MRSTSILSNSLCKIACVIIFLVALVQHILILNLPSSSIGDSRRSEYLRESIPIDVITTEYRVNATQSTTRVAIVVPYLGSTLPAWFDAFLFSAQISSSLYDWLIFVDDAPIKVLPSNVKMIRMGSNQFYERFAMLDENPPEELVGQMAEYFRLLMMKQSYIIVEFKPCLGFIFADYLKGYSHWAFADLDILLGRMDSLISADLLNEYDIVTTSFGDTYRMYMRGQLTIHKNSPLVNNIWKSCKHLSNIGTRVKNFVDSDFKEWNFQSAEGCYSKAVSLTDKIKYYVSNTQISDAFGAPLDQKESMLIGSALMRCYEPLEPADSALLKDVAEGRGYSVGQHSDIELRPLNLKSYRCAYWVSPAYEVCLDILPSYADVISDNKQLSYFIDPRYEIIGGKCKEGIISHFQGWKRNYFAATSHPPPLDSHIYLITESGFIPFRSISLGRELSFGRILRIEELSGRLSHLDLLAQSISAKTGNMLGALRGLFESTKYNTPRQSNILGRTNIASSYCAGFLYDVKKCTCPVFGDDIKILHVDPDSVASIQEGASMNRRVTLITAAWADSYYSGAMDEMLDAWDSLKIVVLARSESTESRTHQRRWFDRSDLTIIEVDISHCATFVNHEESKIPTAQDLYLPDNMLFNIGLDLASTELVCIVPSGITFRSYQNHEQGYSQKLFMDLTAKDSDSADPIALVVPIYTALQSPDEMNDLREMESISRAQSRFGMNLEEENKLLINLREVIHREFETGNKDSITKDVNHRIAAPVASNSIRRLTQRIGSIDDQSLKWYIYPNAKYSCGRDQSPKLSIPYKDRRSTPASIEFNAEEFLREHTMMYPVVFNRSSSPHGSTFVRFPEELNGPGCYGTSILRVLAGSGYALQWSHDIFAQENGVGSVFVKGTQSSCACAHGGDPSALRDMSAKLNRYYQRAVQLRITGYGGVYSRSPFGEVFENEQRSKIAEAVNSIHA